ncbi:MAG: RNA polymerase sigma factor [Roseiflexaceae bacterium]
MTVVKTRHLEGDHAARTSLRAGMCDDRTDDELIAMITAGESAAFETLYNRYAANVYRTVLRVVQDQALAEDLVQEVFWRVWRRSNCFAHKRGQVAPWLRAVARNMSVDELRRMRAQPVLVRAEVEQSRMLQLPDEQADVVDSTMKREQRRMIASALQQLPVEQRQVIELNYFGGRTYKEIAAALNHPLGTVKTRARLGLRKLKQALAMEGPRASLSV